MLLVKPFLGCNIKCSYCYEKQCRSRHRAAAKYDLAAVFKKMDEFKNLAMALHGGESLCMPKNDVEAILSKMHALTGQSTIQTNGTLIDGEFVEMFRKYKTSVGISWDGPERLSDYRPGTSKVGMVIDRLAKDGLQVSLITVISKANAGTPARLAALKRYLLHLKKLGISGRMNPCTAAGNCELPEEKLKQAYLDLAAFCLHNDLQWSPFTDIVNGLQGKPRVCSFSSCDIFSTDSAHVLLGDGSVSNCMRTNHAFILLRDPAIYKTREHILKETSQGHGGCAGCQYFTACYGGCPASGIAGDWRNRTCLCPLWKELFGFYEKILNFCGVPILSPAEPVKTTAGCVNDQHADSPHIDVHGDSGGGFQSRNKA